MTDKMQMEKRFIDLSRQAQRRGVVVYSDFLTLNELDMLHRNKAKLESSFSLYGGYDFAERQMVAFLPDAFYYTIEPNYPIRCCKINSSYPKFSEELTHRDVLGAVMNLGIDRSKIGDIVLDRKEKSIYLFATTQIADYIMDNLTQIRHTQVTLTPYDPAELSIQPEFEECTGIIASVRLDNIVACMAKLSRSKAVAEIQAGKVFINGLQQLNNSYFCHPGEQISIRHVGKFIYDKECGTTQKGKVRIQYRQYI